MTWNSLFLMFYQWWLVTPLSFSIFLSQTMQFLFLTHCDSKTNLTVGLVTIEKESVRKVHEEDKIITLSIFFRFAISRSIITHKRTWNSLTKQIFFFDEYCLIRKKNCWEYFQILLKYQFRNRKESSILLERLSSSSSWSEIILPLLLLWAGLAPSLVIELREPNIFSERNQVLFWFLIDL